MYQAPVFIGLQISDASAGCTEPTLSRLGLTIECLELTSSKYYQRLQHLYPWLHNDSDYKPPTDLTQLAVPTPVESELNRLRGEHLTALAYASQWVELDARSPARAQVALQVLEHELRIASDQGVHTVVIPGPRRRSNLGQYGHSISHLLSYAPGLHLTISTPMCESVIKKDTRSHDAPATPLSTWHAWHCVRTICGYLPRLSVALKIRINPVPADVYQRWLCEPVSVVFLGLQAAFARSAEGHPVLTKATKTFLQHLARRPLVAVIEPGNDTPHALKQHLRYVSRIFSQREITAQKSLLSEFADVLQVPLQPLGSPISLEVYDTFEADQVKYTAYASAIEAALLSDLKHVTEPCVVIAGAGRGPLVSHTLALCEKHGRKPILWAVDINSSATSILETQKNTCWSEHKVTVVKADIRSWQAPLPVHLIISEMLGSFGDNELAPECLGVFELRQERAAQCVIIPKTYTSWVAPVVAPIPWAGSKEVSLHHPFIAAITEDMLLSSPKPAWQFKHLMKTQINTRQAAKIDFSITGVSVVHGFAGYLTAELYPGISLSSVPTTATPGMVSWFPMFFPLESPLELHHSSNKVTFHLWRQGDSERVWYEWLTTSGEASKQSVSSLHNQKGFEWSVALWQQKEYCLT